MENCLPRDSSDTVEPDAPDACWQTTIVTSVTVGTDQCMYYVRRRVEASRWPLFQTLFFNPHWFSIPLPPRLDWLALV